MFFQSTLGSDHRHSGRIRSTANHTQCFSGKNANTNEEFSTKKNRPGLWEVPELSANKFYVISHPQVSQISKITSKK